MPYAVRALTVFISIIMLLNGCGKKPAIDAAIYQKEIYNWQIKRAEALKKDNGWLTLCGLFWLKQGENRFGTDSSNAIIFPPGKTQKIAGSIYLDHGTVMLESRPRTNIRHNDSLITRLFLQTDEEGKAKPSVLTIGSLNFFVIKRGEKLGVRVRDNKNPARMDFRGLDFFPTGTKWRIEAKFEPYNPPRIIPIVNVLSQTSNDTCPGAILFSIDSKTYRLDALTEGNEFFIIFHDETAGDETYGMGRFLSANLPDSANNVILDFNKAYNPPCAFTVFATCPMPPKQNFLDFRVEAGEKKYSGSAH